MGPIGFLRQQNITVWVRETQLEPQFHFAYTNPDHDRDVSAVMHHDKKVEAGISHVSGGW